MPTQHWNVLDDESTHYGNPGEAVPDVRPDKPPLTTATDHKPPGFSSLLPPFNPPSISAPTSKPQRRPRKMAATPSKRVVGEVVDQSPPAQDVRDYLQHLRLAKCSACSAMSPIDEDGDILNLFDSLTSLHARTNHKLTTSSYCLGYACTSSMCIGCGADMDGQSIPKSLEQITPDQAYDIACHCDDGRLAMIFVLLCGFDHRSKHNKPVKYMKKALPRADLKRTYPTDNMLDLWDSSLPSGTIVYSSNGKHLGQNTKTSTKADPAAEKAAFEDTLKGYGMLSSSSATPKADDWQQPAKWSQIGATPAPSTLSKEAKSQDLFAFFKANNNKISPLAYSPGACSSADWLPKGPAIQDTLQGPERWAQQSQQYVPVQQHSPHNYANLKSPDAPPMSSAYPQHTDEAIELQPEQYFPKQKQSPFYPLPGDIYPGGPHAQSAYTKGPFTSGLSGAPSGFAKPSLAETLKSTEEKEDDSLTAHIMHSLALLLPSLERTGAFDEQPPTTVASLLCRSSLLDRAAELLRSTSLVDIGQRAALYHALVQFVEALAEHPSTSSLVYGRRAHNVAGHNLLKVAFGKKTRVHNEPCETGQSFAECIKGVARSSATIVQHDHVKMDDEHPRWLFQKISALADILKANETVGQPQVAAVEDPFAWQKDVAVQDIPDEDITANYTYMSKSASMTGAQALGRMKRITSELCGLPEGLPENIFVRYGTSRPDIMKVLMVGPVGTPYENGLFEFDIHLPAEYPTQPPEMWFRTTGNGTVRFNPNLYKDGKVCLSLLGTFPGPGWIPGESTLLQVLLSVQSMVLGVEQPRCNEPGWAIDADTEISWQFNRNLHPHTVKHAMLGWLEPRGRSIWDDIVGKHFKANEASILATVERWVADKPTPSQRESVRLHQSSNMWTGWSETSPADPTGAGADSDSKLPVGEMKGAFPSLGGAGLLGKALSGLVGKGKGRREDEEEGGDGGSPLGSNRLISGLKGALAALNAPNRKVGDLVGDINDY